VNWQKANTVPTAHASSSWRQANSTPLGVCGGNGPAQSHRAELKA
jgi:hypothetical protein